MDDIQIFRTKTAELLVANMRANLDDARSAVFTEYQYGSRLESWTWGNYTAGSPIDLYVRGEESADWWSREGAPHVVLDPVQKYMVLTLGQNAACNAREGAACKGWG